MSQQRASLPHDTIPVGGRRAAFRYVSRFADIPLIGSDFYRLNVNRPMIRMPKWRPYAVFPTFNLVNSGGQASRARGISCTGCRRGPPFPQGSQRKIRSGLINHHPAAVGDTVSCQCPLWVKSGHVRCTTPCPLCPRKRHQMRHSGMLALGQKRTWR